MCNIKVVILFLILVLEMIIIVFGFVLYVKFTHSKNTFSQWYWHYNILEASLSSIMAILLITHPNDSDAMTQISSLPWWRYFYQTWSSIAEFSYLTLVSISPLKPPLKVIHWNFEYLLYIQLVYKTSSSLIHSIQLNLWYSTVTHQFSTHFHLGLHPLIWSCNYMADRWYSI